MFGFGKKEKTKKVEQPVKISRAQRRSIYKQSRKRNDGWPKFTVNFQKRLTH